MSENFEELAIKENNIINTINQYEGVQLNNIIIPINIHQDVKITIQNLLTEGENIKTYCPESHVFSEFPEFSDKNFQEIIENLKPLGYSLKISLFLVYFFKLKNENQVFEYTTTDRFGKFKHPWIGKKCKNGITDKCEICDNLIFVHHAIPEIEAKRADAIFSAISSLDLKENLSGEEVHLNELNLDKYSCQICYYTFPKLMMFSMNNALHEICIGCLMEYLNTEISCNRVMKMHCPHCSDILSEDIIKKFTNIFDFEKYVRFRDNHLVLTNPLFRFCPKCPKIIHLKDENQAKGICSDCKAEICTQCNHTYHDKISCSAALESELKTWSNKKEVQRCPKCKILVEKIEGCNHMSCYLCHYEFCWLCKGAYTSVHFFPLNPLGCPGLQSMKTKVQNWNCMKRYIIRFICLILCIILLPLFVVFYLPLLFCAYCFESRFYQRKVRRKGCIAKTIFTITLIILCIILEPLFLAIEAIGVVPMTLILIVLYIMERKKRNKKVINFKNLIINLK